MLLLKYGGKYNVGHTSDKQDYMWNIHNNLPDWKDVYKRQSFPILEEDENNPSAPCSNDFLLFDTSVPGSAHEYEGEYSAFVGCYS